MKLILMTHPTFFVEEDKIITSLFNAGLDRLHVYKPAAEPLYSERLLSLLPESCHSHIMVHENFYLKDEYSLRGIHYDSPEQAPAKLKGKVSCTCRDLSQLKELKKKFDYVFLRNVFDSQSEVDEKKNFSISQLEDAAYNGLIDKNVYALGGINEDTVRAVRKLGFGGVVLCGDLWNRFDIHTGQDYKHLLSHFERLEKIID